MDYDALRLFLHLGRTLHFTRTSRECNISLSALSRTVQRLEAEVGQPLFLRDRRSVALTPAGELFREYAADALGRLQQLRQRLQGASEQLTGTIRIFASVTAVQSFLPRILTSFRRTHPEIHIELETGYALDALARLEQGSVDEFKPENYRDNVRDRVLEAIQRKVDGQEITDEPTEAPQAKIIDLMDALKASLAKRGNGAEDGKPAKPASNGSKPASKKKAAGAR